MAPELGKFFSIGSWIKNWQEFQVFLDSFEVASGKHSARIFKKSFETPNTYTYYVQY
jgi:hypothetical protein